MVRFSNVRSVSGAAIAGVLAMLVLAFPALGEDFERWYAVEMAGKRAGYLHAQQTTAGDLITSRARIVLKMGRGDAGVEVSMEGEFVETTSGKPVSMRSTQRLGNTPMTARYTFGEEVIEIESEQAGNVTTATKPLPEGKWLTPAAAGEFVRKRLEAGAEEIVVRTIDPLTGADPSITTRKNIVKTEMEINGKKVPVFRCSAVNSTASAVESTEYLDENGLAVKAETRLGGIVMVLTMAGPEVAQQKQEGPEMMVRTFVKPEGRITRPRDTTRAVYTLSVPSGEMPEIPGTGSQRAEPAGERSVRVEVGIADRHAAPEGDSNDARFRESSPQLNAEDDVIRGLVRVAVRDAGDGRAARAEAMRAFVHEYIQQKDLGVGFASASEVARQRQGDCSEHAMLLAAMLRADGIPSRVVSGLIFADQFAGERRIFGYHMWTQALLEENGVASWVDLDATLDRAFDATHIALVTTAMGEGETASSLASMVPLLGRLEIKVESVEH